MSWSSPEQSDAFLEYALAALAQLESHGNRAHQSILPTSTQQRWRTPAIESGSPRAGLKASPRQPHLALAAMSHETFMREMSSIKAWTPASWSELNSAKTKKPSASPRLPAIAKSPRAPAHPPRASRRALESSSAAFLHSRPALAPPPPRRWFLEGVSFPTKPLTSARWLLLLLRPRL